VDKVMLALGRFEQRRIVIQPQEPANSADFLLGVVCKLLVADCQSACSGAFDHFRKPFLPFRVADQFMAQPAAFAESGGNKSPGVSQNEDISGSRIAPENGMPPHPALGEIQQQFPARPPAQTLQFGKTRPPVIRAGGGRPGIQQESPESAFLKAAAAEAWKPAGDGVIKPQQLSAADYRRMHVEHPPQKRRAAVRMSYHENSAESRHCRRRAQDLESRSVPRYECPVVFASRFGTE